MTIGKSDGGRRPPGIPTVRDRGVQQATRLVLELIFEADFLAVSYGFWPKRSATDAAERIRVCFPRGSVWVVEADIRDYFGSIDQRKLLDLVAERVSDRRVLKLLRQFRTGNAAERFVQIDRYVAWRLKRLLIKRKGRNLRAGEAAAWTPDWFVDLGLHRLSGTVRYRGPRRPCEEDHR